MQATLLSDIYDIESAVLSGSNQILKRNNITAVPVQRDEADLVTPRVELQVVNITPTNYLIQTRTGFFPRKFTGQLNAVVITDRSVNDVSHSVYVSKVLSELSQYNNYNSGSGMPYHEMGEISFGNLASNTTDATVNTDMTAISFPFHIWVRAEGYPSSV